MPSLTSSEIFAVSVLFGIGLGAVWSVERFIWKIFSFGKILTFIGDFLFMLLWGSVLFVLTLQFTGRIRYFTVIGLVVGFLAVKFTLARFLNWIGEKICGYVQKGCKFIARYFQKPPKLV